MPIPIHNLRVGVTTDASWGNAKDRLRLEDSKNDFWEEEERYWVRHHRDPRKTLFHPGADEGPDLHCLLPARKTVFDDGAAIDDTWTTADSIRVAGNEEWTGKTYFAKQPEEIGRAHV